MHGPLQPHASSSNPFSLLSFIASLFLLLLTNKLVHSQGIPSFTSQAAVPVISNFTSQVSTSVTSFAFDSLLPQLSQLTFQGDANLTSDNSTLLPVGSKFIRLTKTNDSGYPQSGSIGRVLYSTPVRFWDSLGRKATFETTIRFNITSVDDSPADGIAFFIAPVNSTIPRDSGGGRLGIFTPFDTSSFLFAVEFDVYFNDVWDPKYRHIGIDVKSMKSEKDTVFNSTLGQVVTAHINYEPITQTIRVGAISGTQIFNVSHVFNLTSILPEQAQVGISASTGLRVAVFDIHTWQFTSTLV